MDAIATSLLSSGRAAVDLAFFVLLPIMIVMLSIMRWLEWQGWLPKIVATVAPLLRPLGLTGLGVFALIQVMLVSFAAPLATLAVMAKNGTAPRYIASTLAMVLAMSQANVVFPMAAVGLDVVPVMAFALIGGLIAAATAFYVTGRRLELHEETASPTRDIDTDTRGNLLDVINHAGRDAWNIALGALPLLVISLVAVNLVRLTGMIGWLETNLAFLFEAVGYPADTLLLVITKYIAGGTAMMGIVVEQFQSGGLSANDINLLAGLLICPLDVAGVAILAAAGKQVGAVVKPAVLAALVGIAFRVICHTLVYG
ncbi:nucleoside recognition family protein [Oceanobacter mangrovi]|uniref:nucleoside recognition family protein n=1 Tax=Oceanobacter mangrovi TaxID=2862510 RepID=UPI001C8E898D|nr:nucleoside recognition family protein [Oceanobacter mangrovi]